MTAQIAERLRYQGEDVAMCTNPLSDYFAMGGTNPRFESNCTALWRGYVGSWEIIDDRLYLICLNGTLEDGTEASLETIFPGFPDRVFAHWYSGTIRLPQGKQLEYVHMGTAAPSSATCSWMWSEGSSLPLACSTTGSPSLMAPLKAMKLAP